MGRRERNNVRTNSRAAARYRGGGGYRMVSADGGRENDWTRSNHTIVL